MVTPMDTFTIGLCVMITTERYPAQNVVLLSLLRCLLRLPDLDTLNTMFPNTIHWLVSLSSMVLRYSDHNSPTTQAHHDLLDSFPSLKMKSSERKVSLAMSSLQGYYGLKGSSTPSEDGYFRNSPTSDRPLSHHRKSKSLVNVILEEIMEKSNETSAALTREVDSSKWNYNLVQRRQKSVADFTRIPELLLREDNSSPGVLPSRTGMGLALRQKAASRTNLASDSDQNGSSPVAMGMVDTTLNEGSSRVRKSSSTSCLHDQDNSGSSSIWSTSMQALSTAAIGKPIFDGLPKPLTGRKNKAALD
ncbi:uncharacterized protein LOC114173994 isoform X2 [Vigna unguiculata]|uniref:uncharacterized protein LOC114173994 isoform X2 n=1 Tax=Vigna unguiculata TaxID=3917 RepID=UPI001016837C|nr:uncharacterized protein LOC114173994 isoform X2 [Vigna unguiculata]